MRCIAPRPNMQELCSLLANYSRRSVVALCNALVMFGILNDGFRASRSPSRMAAPVRAFDQQSFGRQGATRPVERQPPRFCRRVWMPTDVSFEGTAVGRRENGGGQQRVGSQWPRAIRTTERRRSIWRVHGCPAVGVGRVTIYLRFAIADWRSRANVAPRAGQGLAGEGGGVPRWVR